MKKRQTIKKYKNISKKKKTHTKRTKDMMKDPLNITECDKGEITKHKKKENKKVDSLGEIFDIYCVATRKKPLAALDFSTYGKNKHKKNNKAFKNKVIRYCNEKGVQMLHNTNKGGMYLKSVFFLPKDYKKALKLMYILWYPDFQGTWYDIAIGILLGYTTNNIIYFIKKNHDEDIDKEGIKYIKGIIDSMNITFEDLQKDHKMIHLKKIPLL